MGCRKGAEDDARVTVLSLTGKWWLLKEASRFTFSFKRKRFSNWVKQQKPNYTIMYYCLQREKKMIKRFEDKRFGHGLSGHCRQKESCGHNFKISEVEVIVKTSNDTKKLLLFNLLVLSLDASNNIV